MPRDWRNYIDSFRRWVADETAIYKRVLRLRAYLYVHIPWIETSDMIDYLLGSGILCSVSGNEGWLTLPEHMDVNGEFRGDHQREFERRKEICDAWRDASQTLGYHAEEIIRKEFVDAGYAVQKVTFKLPARIPSVERHIEIDAFCLKDKWHLGVEVKNVTSDVFLDPDKIRRKTAIYRAIDRHFDFCSTSNIIPVLIAPFIDGSFYCLDDRHKGLHCQTLLQFFNPENEELCNQIKEVLKFGNVRVVEEAPGNVKRWIRRIPQMWTERHGVTVERPR